MCFFFFNNWFAFAEFLFLRVKWRTSFRGLLNHNAESNNWKSNSVNSVSGQQWGGQVRCSTVWPLVEVLTSMWAGTGEGHGVRASNHGFGLGEAAPYPAMPYPWDHHHLRHHEEVAVSPSLLFASILWIVINPQSSICKSRPGSCDDFSWCGIICILDDVNFFFLIVAPSMLKHDSMKYI